VTRPGVALATVILTAAAMLAYAPSAQAQESIRAYDIYIDVRRDASIVVTERITVRAAGSEIRRGIYRDFPTRYRDRYGNNVHVGLDVLGVERDDAREAWFTERISNGVRINTGGDDFLPRLPGEYTFTIRYRTTRQIGFFDSHDELYWNAIGTGWIFPIESGTVTVRLPEGVAVDRLHAEGYTGPQGAPGQAYTARIPVPGHAVYQLTAPLRPQEGFTIVLTFPKGILTPPTTAQRTAWFFRDNAGVLVAVAGLIALLVFASRSWWRLGRDPRPGIIIPRYEPPAGFSPSALRYMRRRKYDLRCFSSDLVALGVAGHLKMRKEGKRSRAWHLERVDHDAGNGGGTDLQRTLLERLFPRGPGKLEIGKSYSPVVGEAVQLHRKTLDDVFEPRYLKRHGKRVAVAFAILVATAVAAFYSSGGAGTAAIIAVLALMVLITIIFTALVEAPTTEGRRLLDEIEGLRLYLSVAERDELKRLQLPAGALPRVDPERFEALLPYAVALDVEEAWTKKFSEAVGAAAAAETTRRMTWYSGGGRPGDIGSFTSSLGSGFTSSISSSSSPPGSSSGGGGGGSSGGGGGGGGGGGR
jgi:uncharacterized membrane protein YgcG